MNDKKRLKREKYFKELNNNSYDSLFIHINKNAGRSIESALTIPKFHATAKEFKSEINLESWNRLYKFSFVRNPWDRAVSLYNFRILRGRISSEINFNTWVKTTFLLNKKKEDTLRVNAPQTKWIMDDNNNIIVDFIGRFENIEEDFNTLCKKINSNAKLPHLNKTKHEHYSQYYNDESIEIIKNWFTVDIDMFKYKFEYA